MRHERKVELLGRLKGVEPNTRLVCPCLRKAHALNGIQENRLHTEEPVEDTETNGAGV